MKQYEKGFTLIETLLVIITLALVSFAGWYVWNSNHNKQADDHKTATVKTSAKSEETDLTAGWKSYTSTEGKFSLRYPASWVTATNPDLCDKSTFLLGPTTDTVGKCASDYSGEMMFYSFTVESGPMGLTSDNYENIKVEEATASGVAGERQSGTISRKSESIGPDNNSPVILYIFKSNGVIYKAMYIQIPGYPDVQRDFDTIVTKTLKFTD